MLLVLPGSTLISRLEFLKVKLSKCKRVESEFLLRHFVNLVDAIRLAASMTIQ